MCGLVAVLSKKKKRAGAYVFDIYNKQKARGSKGFGYIAIQDNRIVAVERALSEWGIKSRLLAEKAEFILFHHRYPTSTENYLGTTHPMYISNPELDFDYYVAHNGVLTNETILKAEHEKIGYVYATEHDIIKTIQYKDGSSEIETKETGIFNDSESLAIEVARYIEGRSSRIDARGGTAFWCIQVEKGGDKVLNLFYGRNKGRELCRKNTNKWFVISSETGSLLEDMKMYSLELDTDTFYEGTLDIDESAPVAKRVGFTPPSPTPSYSTNQIDTGILENRKYNRQQALATGYPLTSFVSVWDATGDVKYIPRKFSSLALPTPPVTKNLDWEEKSKEDSEYDPKVLERLETLALEYVENKIKCDELDDKLQDGSIQWAEYKTETERAESNVQIAEDLMSALGLPLDLIEEKIDEYVDEFMYSK